jgi:5-formyltetrahydrofolate cyclo-ligase
MVSDPTASAEVAGAKKLMRERALAERSGISAEDARAAAKAAAANLIGRPELAKIKSIALYSAIRDELSTAPLAIELARRGIRLAYPRVVDAHHLEFHWVESLDELSAGTWGIAEPVPSAPRATPGEVAAFVIPALAFDSAGNRLGWGRGHYDTSLATHADAIRVGYAYDAQLIDKVPARGADVPMDLVVTESRAVVCSAGRL